MESSPFLRHVLTLVSGTATAQAIVFGMTMILTRIFSDADLGQLARYTSVVSIITAVAALRYDMTIMLPKKEAWALACARLGMVCITAVSLAASLVALLLLGEQLGALELTAMALVILASVGSIRSSAKDKNPGSS